MAKALSPWLMFPEAPAELTPEQMGRGPLLDPAQAPPMPVEAPRMPQARRPAFQAMELQPEASKPPPSLMDLVQASLQRRELDSAQLRAEANQRSPGGFNSINLKPLIGLADSWNGTRLADSYTDPSINKDKVRERLLAQATRADEGAANDRLAIAKMFSGEAQNDRRMDNLENLTRIAGMKAENASQNAEIKALKDPKLSGDAYKAAGFAKRLQQSEEILGSLMSDGYSGPTREDQVKSWLPGEIQGAEYKSYDQAVRNFINATLRRESGAAIADSEFSNAKQQYLHQPGDSADLTAQKAANRAQVFESFKSEGGQAFRNIPYVSPKSGKVVENVQANMGTVKVMAPDGQVREIPAGQLKQALAKGGKQVQ